MTAAPLFHELAGRKIIKGNMLQDHVHMLTRFLQNYSVAEVIGYIKGKRATGVARQFSGRTKNFNEERFSARGYAVSTVEFEKNKIKQATRFAGVL